MSGFGSDTSLLFNGSNSPGDIKPFKYKHKYSLLTVKTHKLIPNHVICIHLYGTIFLRFLLIEEIFM